MLFSSLIFLFAFLPLVLAVYFLSPTKIKNIVLLLSSLFFYFWGENFLIWIVLLSTCIDYFCSLFMTGGLGKNCNRLLEEHAPRSTLQKLVLALSLCSNLGLLFFFKYFNFAIGNFNGLSAALGMDSLIWQNYKEIALPLGISFYTFQSMSYTIDVYRGHVRATRNFIDFACFVTMFPQLVAGPIVRYRDVARQIHTRRHSIEKFSRGVYRFLTGLAKKVIIANAVAEIADRAFALPADQLSCAFAWLGIISYSLQIYFDFSGYSDMAIGLGLMFGFNFPENFNFPYISRSIQEFWRRWHISLSTWFRDYLYIPLGGNRKGPGRTSINLFTVFLLCGLWHGASWNFLLWGLYHGLFLSIERLGLGKVLRKVPRPLAHIYCLLVVIGGWVLFRAETLSQAGQYFSAMLAITDASPSLSFQQFAPAETLVAIVAGLAVSAPLVPATIAAVKLLQYKMRHSLWAVPLEITTAAARLLLLAAIFIWSTVLLAAGTYNPFIYFRF